MSADSVILGSIPVGGKTIQPRLCSHWESSGGFTIQYVVHRISYTSGIELCSPKVFERVSSLSPGSNLLSAYC